MAAFNYYINRILTLPVTKQAKQQEWKIKLATAKNNKFTRQNIHNLQKKLRTKQKRKNLSNTTTQQTKKWITFTYYSPLIRKIIKLFKQANLNITLRITNTTHQQHKPHWNKQTQMQYL